MTIAIKLTVTEWSTNNTDRSEVLTAETRVPTLTVAAIALESYAATLESIHRMQARASGGVLESVKAGMKLADDVVRLREQISAVSDELLRVEQDRDRWKAEARSAGSTHPDFERL